HESIATLAARRAIASGNCCAAPRRARGFCRLPPEDGPPRAVGGLRKRARRPHRLLGRLRSAPARSGGGRRGCRARRGALRGVRQRSWRRSAVLVAALPKHSEPVGKAFFSCNG